MKRNIIYISTIIASIFIGIIGTILVFNLVIETEKTISEITITESDSIASAVEKIYDATVYIEAFGGNRVISSGTGFVYKVDGKYGYIITNNHVIERAGRVDVVNANGQRVTANILGKDVFSDIAVLSIEKDAVISIAQIGSSIESRVGDTIFTVGSPMGKDFMNSVTKGILSGKDRTVEVELSNGKFLMDVLQVDASINPGNSGGPLCNINGEVIGVNTLKLVANNVEGMGFAIPIEIVMGMVEDLEQGNEVKRPMIGIDMLDVNDTWSLLRTGLQVDRNITTGVVIVTVAKDFPADVAGLRRGDVVTEVNSVRIQSIPHFRYLLFQHSLGDTIRVKFNRDGRVSEVNILLNKSIN